MSKELEKNFMNDIMDKCELEVDPKDIAMLLYDIYDVPSSICEQIKDVIQRLESIDNSNPNRALESLKAIKLGIRSGIFYSLNDRERFISNEDFNIVENYILKVQELEMENAELKRVIKEKRVDFCILMSSESAKNYNSSVPCYKGRELLTQEEFELLKKYFNKH